MYAAYAVKNNNPVQRGILPMIPHINIKVVTAIIIK